MKYASCCFRSDGQLSHVEMEWTCRGPVSYELGLPTGKVVWSLYDHSNESLLTPSLVRDARIFPYIAPCMGELHHDPGSDETLALMKGWIDDCQRSHQRCKTPQQVRGPKRLLHCLSDGSVRLERQSPTQHRDYIALPYCWGDGMAVKKTTMETVDSHHVKIPGENLPRLYREVVALARGLNINYVWIDSLCIIQDSKEDKDEELMRMSDIFRGAFVVVVAAAVLSPLEPLLRLAKTQPGESYAWRLWRTASMVSYQEKDFDVKFRIRCDAHRYPNADEDTPTGSRAWCFQEKLLASRCLVFCEDEVVWECRSCCLCECGKEQKDFSVAPGSGNASNSSWPLMTTMEPYRQMLLPLAEHEPQLDGTLKYFADGEAAYSFWETAVKNYSVRALTFQTDRLPAISAVASIVAEATGDRYLAGLWRDDLLAGLSWRVQPPGPYVDFKHTTPHQWHQEYIAPTWSWASLTSIGISYRLYRTRHSRDAHLDASVDKASTVLERQNPFGRVSDAAIVLSGLHCDAELTTSESDTFHQLDFGHGDVQKVDLGIVFLPLGGSVHFEALDYIHVEPDTDGNSRYLRRVTDWQTRDQRQRQPVFSGTVRLLWLEKDICLILTPSRRKEGAYERLGILHPEMLEQTIHSGRFKTIVKMPNWVRRTSITLV